MLIPVTNFSDLTGGGVHATFGSPILFDLGGLGIRDIRSNGAGQFLIIAGTADDANSGFVLYEWDGNPAHAPRQTGTTLPQLPSADNLGAWETIESVPSPLRAGSPVQLMQDDGDVDFYGDRLTSKTGEITDLQKDLGLVFSYAPPAPSETTTTVIASANPAAPGTAVTLTAVVTGPSDEAKPTGTVTFDVTGADGSTVSCPAATMTASGVATCTIAAGGLRASGSVYRVTASYRGDTDDAASTGTAQLAVNGAPTTTAAVALSLLPLVGKPVSTLVVVAPTRSVPALLTGPVKLTVHNAAGTAVYTTTVTLPKLLPLAAITIPGSAFGSAGSYTVSVAYSGDEFYAPSSTTATVVVHKL
jgi:hypothetical protein